MAAARGPRAGAEGERLLRAVTRLQACARGFLLRRRLRGLREEFEAVVLEIEGHLRQLRWTGRALPRPRFGPEVREQRGSIPGTGTRSPREVLSADPALQDRPDPAQPGFLPRAAAQPQGSAQLSPGKPLDPGHETIPKTTPEKPDPPGAENIPPSAPLPRGTTPKPPKPPDLGSGAAKSLEEEGRALEWDKESVSWEWDSSELGASPEIPAELRALPRSELQSQRKLLLMELLWVQQAIASRKHFLMLKQKLGIPQHSRSIPEFLDGCGEALELQHQS